MAGSVRGGGRAGRGSGRGGGRGCPPKPKPPSSTIPFPSVTSSGKPPSSPSSSITGKPPPSPTSSITDRNTEIGKDIVDAYKAERKKAIEYMAGNKSRVAITTDMWTADNQKKGYMAITGHFIDDSWKLRSVIMRFIYVPAPHTGEVIAEELHETLISWNLDEKLSAVMVDNCTTNDKTVELLVTKIGKTKLMMKDGNNGNLPSFWTCLQDNQEVLPPPDLESCA